MIMEGQTLSNQGAPGEKHPGSRQKQAGSKATVPARFSRDAGLPTQAVVKCIVTAEEPGEVSRLFHWPVFCALLTKLEF